MTNAHLVVTVARNAMLLLSLALISCASQARGIDVKIEILTSRANGDFSKTLHLADFLLSSGNYRSFLKLYQNIDINRLGPNQKDLIIISAFDAANLIRQDINSDPEILEKCLLLISRLSTAKNVHMIKILQLINSPDFNLKDFDPYTTMHSPQCILHKYPVTIDEAESILLVYANSRNENFDSIMLQYLITIGGAGNSRFGDLFFSLNNNRQKEELEKLLDIIELNRSSLVESVNLLKSQSEPFFSRINGGTDFGFMSRWTKESFIYVEGKDEFFDDLMRQ